MLSRPDAENHLKELKSELKRWHRISRSNPQNYVREYIGMLERRIEAYEKILPRTRELCYKSGDLETEVRVPEHWGM